MLNEFYSKTLTLIKNKGLRRLMSINAKRTANKNFSIKNRNKKLSKIYQSALE